MGGGVGAWSCQDPPYQAPKVRAKTRKEEFSSQHQIFSWDAEFLFGCHWGSPAQPEGLRNSQTCLDCAFFMAPAREAGEWVWWEEGAEGEGKKQL